MSVCSIDLLLLFAFPCLFKPVSAESIMCWFSVKQSAELTLPWLADCTAGKVNQVRKMVSGSRVNRFSLKAQGDCISCKNVDKDHLAGQMLQVTSGTKSVRRNTHQPL